MEYDGLIFASIMSETIVETSHGTELLRDIFILANVKKTETLISFSIFEMYILEMHF